jgi:exonuclease VII large subunit
LGRSTRRSLRAVRTALGLRSGAWRTSLRGYVFRLPTRKLQALGEDLDLRLADLRRSLVRVFEDRSRALVRLEDRLPLVDPLLPLRRGYSLTYLLGKEVPLRDPSSVSSGDRLVTRLAQGRIVSSVEEVIARDGR